MRPLRYFINVTLDGCCDHRAMFADEDLHRHAVENELTASRVADAIINTSASKAGARSRADQVLGLWL
jgi:hypothetical protein